MIRNPILKGFNPDPSICRVGADYYIATSTFEWYPGVQIHHSRDLVNWRLVKRPLDRASQLDMRGNPDCCGVWAPCLSHADGRFWLIYTDVKRLDGNFKDAHNYLVTAPAITGPWSDPIYLNSSGFDPSLFHDDDGRKWLLNLQWKHSTDSVGGTPKHSAFDGILLQEYDPVARHLTGPIRNIFAGSPHGLVEGPHLFKRDGWYYLTTAEGGTGYDHAVTMARSRALLGPYELHPDTHLLTSKDAPDAAAAARRPRPDRRDPRRPRLPHPPLRPPASRPPPLPARPRDRAPALRLGRRRLAPPRPRRPRSPALEVPAAARRPRARARPPGRAPLRRPRAARRVPVAAHPLPRAHLHPDRRRPAPARPRVRSAAGSSRRWSPAARSTSATAPRPGSASPPTPTSRPPASRPTTTATSSTSSPSPTTPTLGRVLTIMSCPGDWPDGRLSFPARPPAAPARRPGRARRRGRRRPPALLLARRRRLDPARPRARRQRHLRRGRPRRARLLHRRLRRHGRLRHLRPRRRRRLRPVRLPPAVTAFRAPVHRRRVLALLAAGAGLRRSAAPARAAAELIGRMTLAEKIGQLTMVTASFTVTGPVVAGDVDGGGARRPGRQPLQPLGPRRGARRPADRGRGDPPRHPALLRPRRPPRLPHHLPDPARRGRRLRPGALGGDRPPRRRGGRRRRPRPDLRADARHRPRPALGPHRRGPGRGPARRRPLRRRQGARLPGRRRSPASPPPPSTSSPTAPAPPAATTPPSTSPSAPSPRSTCRRSAPPSTPAPPRSCRPSPTSPACRSPPTARC